MLLIRSFNPFLRLLIILIICNLKLQSKGDCAGDKEKPKEGQECCTNLRIVEGHCEVCEAGYFGSRCAWKCFYPTFGLKCQGNCMCSQSECDPRIGCRKKECIYPSFGLSCQDNCNCSQSDCDSTFGCPRNERSTNMLSTASSVDKSFPETVTASSSISSPIKPYTTTIKTEKETHINQENNTKDNKFVVALSVTVSSSVLIVFAVVLSKLRGNNKGNVIYYVQNPENNTPQPVRNQFRVPFRNLETDIYMEIEEVVEMDEISNTSCGTIHDMERESFENL